MNVPNKQTLDIRFFCPRWGSESIPWNQFLEEVKSAGFDGVEIGIPQDEQEREEVLQAIGHKGLFYIAQHWETNDANFENHKSNYVYHLSRIAETRPYSLNAHTGKDHFTIEQNLELLDIAGAIEKEYGINISHETHRGRHSFAAHVMPSYLNARPNLRITLDVSHWFCVAESLLEDQEKTLDLCLPRVDHIHARIGHTQGPQVIDPRDPIWEATIERHFAIWDKIVAIHTMNGSKKLSITTEFGPPPYLVSTPKGKTAQAFQFELNSYMLNLLRERYQHHRQT